MASNEIQSINVFMDDIMAQVLVQYNVWNVQAEAGAFGDDWIGRFPFAWRG
jgi:hypothetical protein